jgi:Zn ribbon nucleic-acid-binding protein
MEQTPACRHRRTRLIAKDKDAEYVECLDCGALLEAGEVPETSQADAAGFNESLSDA